ncbi:hypothetical protein V6N13_012319 [Hibiscus sabdariffa]|uniref:Uncharacterized protein n=1 Tax=Hibiscus sabdariffa TaxID=183260 RepID=A0ABR2SES7_9ROSI
MAPRNNLVLPGSRGLHMMELMITTVGKQVSQPTYATQRQYVKPLGSYTYGLPVYQSGEVPYQGPSGQSYGPNLPPQQQNPYASGLMQQSYPPYDSAPPGDG